MEIGHLAGICGFACFVMIILFSVVLLNFYFVSRLFAIYSRIMKYELWIMIYKKVLIPVKVKSGPGAVMICSRYWSKSRHSMREYSRKERDILQLIVMIDQVIL